MDQWLEAGGSDITPSTRRRHSMTDAVVIARIEPFSVEDSELEEGDAVLGQRTTQDPSRVLTGPSGVSIEGGGQELVQVLFDLLALLETTTVATVAGPQPLSSVAGLGEIKTRIQAIGRGVS